MARHICLFFCFALTGILPINASESIGFYYNKIDSVRELINYDRVVVNADYLSERQLSVLHKAETRVFAYLSIGELDLQVSNSLTDPQKSELSLIPHSINPVWKTRVIDQTSRVWQSFLFEKSKHFLNRGFDGIFLDTLDSYQLLDNKKFNIASQEKSLKETIDGIQQIVKKHGAEKTMLINRGFELLDQLLKKDNSIEAIVAESLFQKYNLNKQHYYPASQKETLWLTKRLKNIQKQGKEIIVIDYSSPWDRSKQRELAKRILQLGFTPYVSDGLLNTLGISTIEPVGKRILGFYDGHFVNDMTYSKCHRLLAMTIEYLGYIPECVDVNKVNLQEIDLTRYAGIVFWLSNKSFENNPTIYQWISNLFGKKKFLFLGALPNHRVLLNKLGISRNNDLTGKISVSKGEQLFKSFGNKVIPFFSPFENYPSWKVSAPNSEVMVELKAENKRHSQLVFKTEWGGAALTPMPISTLANNQSRWLLDPFWIIKKFLQLEDVPVADVTTESGSRIFTTHIDGDGFPSRSGFTKQPFVSQVILDEVLKKRTTPHTVSVIEGEVSKSGLYPKLSEELENIAKEMFKLSHVEAASHTYSHPFYWNQKTAKKQKSYGDHLAIKNYQLDYKREIIGSAHYVKSLLPANKQVKLILWSGSADPTEKQILIAENAGLLNVNGGNTYSVKGSDDFSEVSPSIVWYKKATQVYAPVQNENLYTNLWTEHFDGFSRTIETFNNLNSPKRIKPISLYYHMYSGTYPASLQSLNKVYDWVDTQNTTPLFLSEYANRAKTIYETGISKNIFGGWQVVSTGIKSIRLPLSLGLPDMTVSDIAGWKTEEDGRYLSLVKPRSHLVVLPSSGKQTKQQRFVNGNAQLLLWDKQKKKITWKVKSHVPLEMTLRNFQNCQFQNNQPLEINQHGRLTRITSTHSGIMGGVINCQ